MVRLRSHGSASQQILIVGWGGGGGGEGYRDVRLLYAKSCNVT